MYQNSITEFPSFFSTYIFAPTFAIQIRARRAMAATSFHSAPLPIPIFTPSNSDPSTTTKWRHHQFKLRSTSSGSGVFSSNSFQEDAALLSLLRNRKTDDAFSVYSLQNNLPGTTCLSRLVAQLSYQNTPTSLSRAQSIIRRLRDDDQLHRLDANSLGLLVVSAARAGSTLYALSLLRAMLRIGYIPHVKAWSAVASRLAAAPDDGPLEALGLFSLVTERVRAVMRESPSIVSDCRPDTGAFNAAFNACANLGNVKKFAEVFEEMTEFGVKPDVLTYNIIIKLCARARRQDLLGLVLEKIIRQGITPCMTTLHSLVAAYVGFRDLDTAEKIVQAMREGRRDICGILRHSHFKEDVLIDGNLTEDEVEINVILDRLVRSDFNDVSDPPLLLKTYTPDSRMYTTLMKGYMKEGRVDSVVHLIEAMRREKDPKSHPDQVTYTTVITALVNAGAMDRARSVLLEMGHAGVPANRVTYNVLLKGYCQQLQMDRVKELLEEMKKVKGIEPNVVSYNILIDGCIFVDDSAGALFYFNEMREQGINPSKVSYTTLMKAFALNNQPKLAQNVFDEMVKDRRVKVDRVAWNMLIEGYCRLGLVEDAKKLIEMMKESNFIPDVATYGSLANGIALARKPGEALLLWNEVKERCKSSPRLRPDEGLLGTLADICVRAAFFKKALEIVVCMEENGIAPNKIRYKRIYVEMHSKMFTSKHASQARQDKRKDRKRAAEAFKFWLGLPNSYYGSEWRLDPLDEYG